MLTLAFNIQPVKAESGSWIWVRDTITGAWGEAVVGTGTALYIARGTSFYRYRPVDDSLVELTSPPKPDSKAFKTGTALAWDGDDYIYALYGAATGDSRRWFYRYSISGNSWEALTNTPADQGEGDAIAWSSLDNRIYATIGGEQRPTHFVRYAPSTNSWDDAAVADPPAGMGDGASLVWTGGNFLYTLRGEFDETSPLYDFWRYDILTDTWTAITDIPADSHNSGVGGVGDGGSLLYIGLWLSNQTDFIYALSGNQAYPESIPDNRFYRYTVSTDSWQRLTDLSFGVGYYVGNRLGYADGHIYAWQGTPSTWTGGGNDLARYDFPVDSTPPTIGIPSRVPDSDVLLEQSVKVSVNITDAETGVKNVTLSYTTDNGTSWLDLPMNYNSITSLYEATIPGQLAGTWVKYQIIAHDNAENPAINDNNGQYYAYQVLLDTDGDGIPDITDPDDDNDGVNDDEDAFPLDPTEWIDTDGDGIGNNADTDDDNDGVPDANDAFPLDSTESVDTDGDGVGDNADTDDDNDGVPDVDDAFPLVASESLDTDGDGIGNNADTDDDNDGIPDTWETENGLNPLDAADASLDPDGDGLTNLEEYQQGTDPKVSDAETEAFPLWTIGVAGAVALTVLAVALVLWKRKGTKTSQTS